MTAGESWELPFWSMNLNNRLDLAHPGHKAPCSLGVQKIISSLHSCVFHVLKQSQACLECFIAPAAFAPKSGVGSLYNHIWPSFDFQF